MNKFDCHSIEVIISSRHVKIKKKMLQNRTEIGITSNPTCWHATGGLSVSYIARKNFQKECEVVSSKGKITWSSKSTLKCYLYNKLEKQ